MSVWDDPEWKLLYMLIQRLTSSSIDHWSVSIVRWPRLHHFPIFFVSLEISSSTNLSLKNFYFWTTNKQDKKKVTLQKCTKEPEGALGFQTTICFVISQERRSYDDSKILFAIRIMCNTDYGHPMTALFSNIPNILANWVRRLNRFWGILGYFW